MEKQKEYYIRCRSKEESRAVQTILFEMGYYWHTHPVNELKNTQYPFICVDMVDNTLQVLDPSAGNIDEFLEEGLFTIEASNFDELDTYFEAMKFDLI